MANDFFSQVYAGTGLGDYLKSWQHATRIFVDGNYRLSPKYSFLFHVAFDLDPNLTRMSSTNILEAGMLVKTMQLPKYTIDNKTYNAYNRKNIVQQSIKYDPVTITFHDDSSDTIRDLWYDYMSYYYRDTDYTPTQYLDNDKYNTRQNQNWGFSPGDANFRGTQNNRLIQRIRLYSLHQKQFTEYVLINPVITSFQHGEHQQGANETLQHTMTLSYETVLYNYGTVNPGQDTNFAELHYDSTPSPLGLPNLAGSLIDSLTGGNGIGGVLGGLGSALTGTLPKTGDQQIPGSRTKFANNNQSSGIGSLLSQIALGISKGNNPLQNLSVPTLAGYAQTITGGGGLGIGSGLGVGGIGGVGGIVTGSGGFMGPNGATPNLNLAATAASGISFSGVGPTSATGQGAVSNGETVTEASQFGASTQNFNNIGSFATDQSGAIESQTEVQNNQGTAFGAAPQNFSSVGNFPQEVETQTLEAQGTAFAGEQQNFNNVGGFPDSSGEVPAGSDPGSFADTVSTNVITESEEN